MAALISEWDDEGEVTSSDQNVIIKEVTEAYKDVLPECLLEDLPPRYYVDH